MPKTYIVQLTVSIEAENEAEAIKEFTDNNSLDFWNNGDNIEVEEE